MGVRQHFDMFNLIQQYAEFRSTMVSADLKQQEQQLEENDQSAVYNGWVTPKECVSSATLKNSKLTRILSACRSMHASSCLHSSSSCCRTLPPLALARGFPRPTECL